MQEHNPYVPNVHFEQIPIKNLVSNQEYQRNISQSHVENAAAHCCSSTVAPPFEIPLKTIEQEHRGMAKKAAVIFGFMGFALRIYYHRQIGKDEFASLRLGALLRR